jgi:FKBP-type peptidyl-prolyl cis-trans isomerase (trigger factor)
LTRIDWDEYKEHKKMSVQSDNFERLIEFMKSYYNMHNPDELFETLKNDDTAVTMLNKRSITSAASMDQFVDRF